MKKMGKMIVGAGIFFAGIALGYAVGVQPVDSVPSASSNARAPRKAPAKKR